jgi:hypothetical protein
VNVETEVGENLLCYSYNHVERSQLVKVKVVFDAERLWIVKTYEINKLSGAWITANNDTVAFLGCAVCSRSVCGNGIMSDGQSGTAFDVTTQTYSIISPELASSKIAEARALVDE